MLWIPRVVGNWYRAVSKLKQSCVVQKNYSTVYYGSEGTYKPVPQIVIDDVAEDMARQMGITDPAKWDRFRRLLAEDKHKIRASVEIRKIASSFGFPVHHGAYLEEALLYPYGGDSDPDSHHDLKKKGETAISAIMEDELRFALCRHCSPGKIRQVTHRFMRNHSFFAKVAIAQGLDKHIRFTNLDQAMIVENFVHRVGNSDSEEELLDSPDSAMRAGFDWPLEIARRSVKKIMTPEIHPEKILCDVLFAVAGALFVDHSNMYVVRDMYYWQYLRPEMVALWRQVLEDEGVRPEETLSYIYLKVDEADHREAEELGRKLANH